jgi:hypothetical protein
MSFERGFVCRRDNTDIMPNFEQALGEGGGNIAEASDLGKRIDFRGGEQDLHGVTPCTS